MIAKPWIKLGDRHTNFTWLGYAAQIALAFSILLERLGNPALDFISGLLLGFSLVGNLAFIFAIAREKKEQNQ